MPWFWTAASNTNEALRACFLRISSHGVQRVQSICGLVCTVRVLDWYRWTAHQSCTMRHQSNSWIVDSSDHKGLARPSTLPCPSFCWAVGVKANGGAQLPLFFNCLVMKLCQVHVQFAAEQQGARCMTVSRRVVPADCNDWLLTNLPYRSGHVSSV